jgi:hypothetical protein
MRAAGGEESQRQQAGTCSRPRRVKERHRFGLRSQVLQLKGFDERWCQVQRAQFDRLVLQALETSTFAVFIPRRAAFTPAIVTLLTRTRCAYAGSAIGGARARVAGGAALTLAGAVAARVAVRRGAVLGDDAE